MPDASFFRGHPAVASGLFLRWRAMVAGIPFSDEVAVVMSRFLMCWEAREMHSVCRDARGEYTRANVCHRSSSQS